MEKGEGENVSSFLVGGPEEQRPTPKARIRKARPKKMEFIGWGSKSLVEFLQSIGMDTNKQLSQYEVTGIIDEYVRKFNLLHPEKKKKVVCDERLHSLFGKKSLSRNRISDLLEQHFTENHDSSEDDLLYSSEEYEEDGDLKRKRQNVSSSEKKTTNQKKEESGTPKSCFAAIISENINLLYLKRTLVQDLLKNPESFEGKLMGSYIRIKFDRHDPFQKNTHQLHPVTGVKIVPENGDVGREVLFQVPNVIKDIPISILSDADFSKEECEDLCQRVKDGLLKRRTVAEFEEKAQILHEDITKHWLPREIDHLQNLIDRANEKGLRKELFEYLQRKQLLLKPSEQSRLLLELPKVVADEPEGPEPESTSQEQDPNIDAEPLYGSKPMSTSGDALNITIDSGSGAKQALSTSQCLDAAGSSRDVIGGQGIGGPSPTKGIAWIRTANDLPFLETRTKTSFYSILGSKKDAVICTLTIDSCTPMCKL